MKNKMMLLALMCVTVSSGQLNAAVKVIVENETETTNFTDITIKCSDNTNSLKTHSVSYSPQNFNIGTIEAGTKVSKQLETHDIEWRCDITVPQPKGSKSKEKDDMKVGFYVDKTKDVHVYIRSIDGSYELKTSE